MLVNHKDVITSELLKATQFKPSDLQNFSWYKKQIAIFDNLAELERPFRMLFDQQS
jgi:hypothetical protein